jgi:sulfite reductase beta subunit-like hemoprotein
VVTGRARADQITELARQSDVYGAGRVRLTTGEDGIIPDVAASKPLAAEVAKARVIALEWRSFRT